MWIDFKPILGNHNQSLLNASYVPWTSLDVDITGFFDWMNARLITSVLKIHNSKLAKICFKFPLVANIQLAEISVQREHKTLIWNVS